MERTLPACAGERDSVQALALERFKEHRDLAKLKLEWQFAREGLEPGSVGAGAGLQFGVVGH